MIDKICNVLNTIKLEIVTFIIALFVPTITGLLFIGLLIFADTLTGVWKTIKTDGWQGVKSRILSDGILPKITMYPLILLIASGCEFNFKDIPFIKSSIFLLMCIELKSLSENLNVILKINFFELVKIYIKKGRKGIQDELLKDND